MITFEECKENLAECKKLGTAPEISVRRATAIMAVCRAWVVLGREVLRYDAVCRDEEPGSRQSTDNISAGA
jgi:hypothetical protein